MLITKFLKDRRGVAAVEFALIFPVLVALLLGSVYAFDLYRADRSVSHAANSVVDLVARQDSMNDDTRDALFATGLALLGGYGTNSSYGVSITSIVRESTSVAGDSNLVVEWSEANPNGAQITDGDIASLDLPAIPLNESVIFIRVENNYAPVFGAELDFGRDFTRRPRFVAKIAYE